MNNRVDLLAETRQCFVDRVVNDLIHEVMQAPLAGIPDVHRGAFAHRFDAFKFLNLVGHVIGCAECCDRGWLLCCS